MEGLWKARNLCTCVFVIKYVKCNISVSLRRVRHKKLKKRGAQIVCPFVGCDSWSKLFMILRIREFYKRLSLFADFLLKSGDNNGTLHMQIYTTFCARFFSVTRQMFIGAKKNVSDKSFRDT